MRAHTGLFALFATFASAAHAQDAGAPHASRAPHCQCCSEDASPTERRRANCCSSCTSENDLGLGIGTTAHAPLFRLTVRAADHSTVAVARFVRTHQSRLIAALRECHTTGEPGEVTIRVGTAPGTRDSVFAIEAEPASFGMGEDACVTQQLRVFPFAQVGETVRIVLAWATATR